MYEIFKDFLKDKKRISVIQAENPDGDSLGSALALSYLLTDYEVSLFCPVDIPKYLRYFNGHGLVTNEFDLEADGYIIVDTAAGVLLSKLLDVAAIKNRLFNAPILVIDHHETPDDLPFEHVAIIEQLPACCEVIFKIAKAGGFKIGVEAAENILSGIMSDTLGLTSESTTAETYRVVAELIDCGVSVAALEERRRDFMKKSPRILDYKADLIKKVEYSLDGKLATIHIPWEEIREFSDEYNPNALILEEMRLVEGVDIAIAIKTYPDGKVTGKIRAVKPIADKVAGYFGGGGHPLAAGFRTYDTSYAAVKQDLVRMLPELLAEFAPAPEPASGINKMRIVKK